MTYDIFELFSFRIYAVMAHVPTFFAPLNLILNPTKIQHLPGVRIQADRNNIL